ncbi:DUF3039 domain-containing protein [Propioniciclava soli]|uniref:DUF3039 domain-containing protein n=1 Tax=Propioniciclava soli TaxID=2775081 RepID=A0ABZ3C3T3_9ACTN
MDELQPLSELPHPLIAKSAQSVGPDATTDNVVGPIAVSTQFPLWEVKTGQWRGGIHLDPQSGVAWLVVAGLAKGDHEDRDDFYQRVQREHATGDPTRWLPTDLDQRLLKRETAARLMTEWELLIQRQLFDALRSVSGGGTTRVEIGHPHSGRGALAVLDITVTPVRDDSYEADEMEVTVMPASAQAGSALVWQLTIRSLITFSPPEQGWDRYRDTYSVIEEPGYFAARAAELAVMVNDHELAVSQPGGHAHFTHRHHLAGKTVHGEAVRALCGVFFVPKRDHEALPTCPRCEQRMDELPT